jgi:putative membrane protein
MVNPFLLRSVLIMKGLLLRWMVLSIAVWLAAAIVPGVGYDRAQDVLIAALVLGILNAFVKPMLQLVSIPFILVTLGLFLIVINALLLRLTAWLVPGFHVAGFWPAAGGSLAISLVCVLLGYSSGPRPTVVRPPRPARHPRNGPPPGKGPIIDV